MTDYDRKEKIIILKKYSNFKIAKRLKVSPLEFGDETYKYLLDISDVSGMRFYEQKLEKLYL